MEKSRRFAGRGLLSFAKEKSLQGRKRDVIRLPNEHATPPAFCITKGLVRNGL